MVLEYINKNILVADGAMGTYYSFLTGDVVNRVEEINLTNPTIIKEIHKEYLENGSKLLRTNTFSANTISLNISRQQLQDIIISAVSNAKEASLGFEVFIAGNIGPIPNVLNDGTQVADEYIINEYKYIIDCLISAGIDIFNFETFSTTDFLPEIVEYIKSKDKNFTIFLQFSITKTGYTRKGKFLDKLINEIEDLKVDIFGFNCGSGPAHLINNLKRRGMGGHVISVYPNAGYPEIVNHRTVFNTSPKYFSETVLESITYGAKIIGGCCGTTPLHIKSIVDNLNSTSDTINNDTIQNFKPNTNSVINKNLIIAVELDPPFKPDLTKILESANILKNIGVDYITLADSPSGRMRLNPITVAARIKRDIKIDVIPHICCRDRNLIALKSDILAAHTEGIRNLLLVTGDPIPQEERDEVTKVFNCNSITLMKQVLEFNNTILKGEEFKIGGALNLSSKNLDVQIKRMNQKIEAGTSQFLTQPIYDNKSIDFLLNIKKPNNVKILAGILPIVTYNNAQFLNNEFPGINIPDELITMFSKNMNREEAENVGIDISVDIVNKLKSHVDGFYFITPFNRVNMIKEIIIRSLN